MTISVDALPVATTRPSLMTGRPLGEIINFRNEVVHPKDRPQGPVTFVGLEHIESNTGVRLGSDLVQLEEMTGRRARFRTGDIVYGYLRPYLNKVWIAEFDGICSVDQYVFKVNPAANRNYVAHFLRSEEFLRTAPIEATPGQLPRIRSGEISETRIPLPVLSEQLRISTILDQADDLRRKRREGIRLLEKLELSIAWVMFGDEGTNSKSYDVRKLGEVTECLDRHRRPVKESDRKAGAIPYYGANGQQGWIDVPLFNEDLVLVAEDGGFFDQPWRGVAYKFLVLLG